MYSSRVFHFAKRYKPLLLTQLTSNIEDKKRTRKKRSSLFCRCIRAKQKDLMRLTPGFNVIKLFSFVTDEEAQ
jgi:hypothetical protein